MWLPRCIDLTIYVLGAPDNKGNRFAIADGNLFYVSTLKSQDVNIDVHCPIYRIESFSVSVGQTYVKVKLTKTISSVPIIKIRSTS
jgi:hypothetical protein